MGTWLIGVAFSGGATLLGTVGKVLIKRSHNINDYKSFYVGLFFVLIINPVLSLAALGFAPQSILAPMSGLGIAWNVVVAPRVLSEPVFLRDYVATALLTGGCVLVSLGGPHDTPKLSREEINSYFSDTAFVVYSALLLGWILALYAFIFTGVDVEVPLVTCADDTIKRTYFKLRRFSFGALAGTIGGLQLFGKAAMESLKSGQGATGDVLMYIFFLCAGITAGLGLYHLNQGLRRYDAVCVVSVYEAFLILNGSVSGLVFFHELEDISSSPLRLCMYFGGLLLTLVGVSVLGCRTTTSGGCYSKDGGSAGTALAAASSPPPPPAAAAAGGVAMLDTDKESDLSTALLLSVDEEWGGGERYSSLNGDDAVEIQDWVIN